MRPSGGGHVHATEGKVSRFSEGANNAFALRKSEAANVSVGSLASIWCRPRVRLPHIADILDAMFIRRDVPGTDSCTAANDVHGLQCFTRSPRRLGRARP